MTLLNKYQLEHKKQKKIVAKTFAIMKFNVTWETSKLINGILTKRESKVKEVKRSLELKKTNIFCIVSHSYIYSNYLPKKIFE